MLLAWLASRIQPPVHYTAWPVMIEAQTHRCDAACIAFAYVCIYLVPVVK